MITRERLTITLRRDLIKKLDKKVDGHILRNRSHAIESFLTEKLKGNILKKAIILGGGEGIEIKGQEVSKLLLPIESSTLIEENIEILKGHGITDLILSLGGFGQQVREKLGDGSKYGIKIVYFERDRGTASILRQAKSILEDTFLMMNGDIYLKSVDLGDMYDFHKNHKAKGTILISSTADPSGLGSVFMKGHTVTKFAEKIKRGNSSSYLINAGVYLLEPLVCEMVTPETNSLEHDIFTTIAKNQGLMGYFLDQPWVHLHDKNKYEAYLKTLV